MYALIRNILETKIFLHDIPFHTIMEEKPDLVNLVTDRSDKGDGKRKCIITVSKRMKYAGLSIF